MAPHRLRHFWDIKGKEYEDRARQTGMGSAFRNKKIRKQFLQRIRDDVDAVSQWMNLFSLHLQHKCKTKAEKPETTFFTKTISSFSSFRKYFNQWKETKEINARPGVPVVPAPNMPDLKYRSNLMGNMLQQYYTGFEQTMFRNRNRRFKTYYMFFGPRKLN